MHVILVMVETLNGKITRGNDPNVSSWASPEDHQHFLSMLAKYPLRVMGRKSFEGTKKHLNLNGNQRRIVVTKHPEQFIKETIPGHLEFTNESPDTLVDRLGKEGNDTVLLLGGGKLNAQFFNLKLINELYITIEPKLFGVGTPLVSEECPEITLQLLSIKQLNTNGTLLLHYNIIYP